MSRSVMVWLWANHKAVNAAKGWLKFDRHCRRIQNVIFFFPCPGVFFFLLYHTPENAENLLQFNWTLSGLYLPASWNKVRVLSDFTDV